VGLDKGFLLLVVDVSAAAESRLLPVEVEPEGRGGTARLVSVVEYETKTEFLLAGIERLREQGTDWCSCQQGRRGRGKGGRRWKVDGAASAESQGRSFPTDGQGEVTSL
jgi:hypothetical protein